VGVVGGGRVRECIVGVWQESGNVAMVGWRGTARLVQWVCSWCVYHVVAWTAWWDARAAGWCGVGVEAVQHCWSAMLGRVHTVQHLMWTSVAIMPVLWIV
jgi:hypothetical protein